MGRNYQNEMNWRKEKYSRIECFIDKKLGEDLKSKLKKEHKTMASWVTESADEYLKD